MHWVRAVMLAFSTYTRIPMPQIKWDDDAMKLAIAFLPLVGVVVGGAVWLWRLICIYFEISAILFAVIALALPVVITGGIHIDGYCDTSDALASCLDKGRKLEILKDPRIGAFALIRFCVYTLINFGLLYELYMREYHTGFLLLYVVSRCLAAWSAMTMPNARKDGMLAAFTENTDRKKAVITLTILTVLGFCGWGLLTFPYGFSGFALCIPVTVWYRRMALKQFGGVTGDTTGYYLQIIELTLIAGVLVGGMLWHIFY